MLTRRLLITVGLLRFALGPTRAQAQVTGRIDMTVLVSGTGVPLPNAVVEIPALNLVALANTQGRVFLADIAPGTYRVAVRHIGYTPRDTTITASGTVSVTIGLSHLAVQLAALRTASEACVKTGLPDVRDSTTEALARVLQQIALNAAQQKLVVERYPFTYTYERTTSPTGVDPATIRMQVDTLEASGTPRWAYKPGEVYQLQPPTRGTQWKTVLHQPTFMSVADPAFQSSHCFAYAGVEDDAGGKRIRVDFRPASSLRDADVEGSIYLDTASYQVTRAVVRFTNLDRASRADLSGLVATSYFEEVAPAISMATLVESQSLLRDGARFGKSGDRSSGRILRIAFTKNAPAGLAPNWQPDLPGAVVAGAPESTPTPLPSQEAPRDTVSARARCTRIMRPGVPGIGGQVRDGEGAPVPFAVMTLDGGYRTQAVSDREGCFYMQLAQRKAYSLITRRIGLKELQRNVDVNADSASIVELHMEPIAVTLSGVTTTAPREGGLEQTGFYDRLLDRQKGLGSATFFTPEDLEKRVDRVTEVISGAIGVHLYQPRSGVAVPVGANGCPLEIWLDGARVSGLGPRSAFTDVDGLVSTMEVAGIEVYPRASQVPPQYQSASNGCGSVVIWTKR